MNDLAQNPCGPLPPERFANLARGIDTRMLRHFAAVVSCKSFTIASKALHITQPALTKSIQKLESRLGVQLLERSRNVVTPTRYGQILAARAKLIELEFAHAISEIESLKHGFVGTVNVGVGPALVNQLPRAILELQKRYPKVGVVVTTNVMDSLVAGLLAGELDVICTATDFPDYPDIETQPLFDVEHTLLARLDHPLRSSTQIEAYQLLEYPWVAFSRDYMGASRLGSFFSSNQLPPPHLAVAVASIDTMLLVLTQSDYLAAIPRTMLPTARAMGLDELALDQPLWRLHLGVSYRRTNRPTEALAALLESLHATFSPNLGV